MIHSRQHLVIVSFLILCFITVSLSIRDHYKDHSDYQSSEDADNQEREDKSVFGDVNYYVLKNDLPFLDLKSTALEIDNIENIVNFELPYGTFYTSRQEPVDFSGKKGVYYKQKEELILEGDVVLNSETSQLLSDRGVYSKIRDEFVSTGNVRTKSLSKTTGDQIFINSDRAVSKPTQHQATYYDRVTGHIKRKKVYEENIYFTTDKLYLDKERSQIDLTGNVDIKKQLLRAKSRRGEIFLENYNKNLKYYVLYDDVKVTERIKQSDGTFIDRRGYGEKLEGIVAKDLVILTGYPKVFQNDDIIKGNKIILRENNEVVEVDDASTNFLLK